MEVKNSETNDWEFLKEANSSKTNIESFKRQAIKLIDKGVYQVHLVVYTLDDPDFQEFYKSDGSVCKMF